MPVPEPKTAAAAALCFMVPWLPHGSSLHVLLQ
jgi:hypothetical protein